MISRLLASFGLVSALLFTLPLPALAQFADEADDPDSAPELSAFGTDCVCIGTGGTCARIPASDSLFACQQDCEAFFRDDPLSTISAVQFWEEEHSYTSDYENIGNEDAPVQESDEYPRPSETQCPTTAFGIVPGPPPPIVKPDLSVKIPYVNFRDPELVGGALITNFLGDYILGVYKYALYASLMIATVMFMVGGLQYAFGSGMSAKQLGAGKARMLQSLTALVILSSVYVVLFFVNPELVYLRPLTLVTIEGRLEEHTSGPEGEVTSQANAGPGRDTLEEAQENSNLCLVTDGISSPTGRTVSYNYHFRNADFDYTKIKAVDFPGSWGENIVAPFDGTVTYTQGSGRRCGNKIQIVGSGGDVTLCHAKDFLNADGQAGVSGTQVSRGQVIGHVGGRCCAGQTPPSDFRDDICHYSGDRCGSPFSQGACDCQGFEQSGNTTGPHVHMTMNGGGNLLSCLEE